MFETEMSEIERLPVAAMELQPEASGQSRIRVWSEDDEIAAAHQG